MDRTRLFNGRNKKVKIGDLVFDSIKQAGAELKIDRRRLRYMIDAKILLNGEKVEYVREKELHEGMGLLRSN